MSSYSATQVISPAIERTRQYLFKPFRMGRFLKLTLVALLTEGGMTSCNFSSGFPSGKSGQKVPPLHMPPFHWPEMHGPGMHWPALPWIIGIVAAAILLMTAIGLVVAYLVIRLRFSYFDCVLHMQDRIGPAWARYHRQALRFLGMSICFGLASWVALIPIGYALYVRFKPLFQSIGSETPPNFFDFLPLIGTGIALILVLSLIAYLVDALLTCFVLPRMALENTSIFDALEDVWNDLRSEPGAFALFLLLRVVLGIAASTLATIVLIVPVIVVVLLGVAIGLILHSISPVLAVVLGVPALVLVVAVFIVVSFALGGTIGTFKRNFAILFYAGRYPQLALILWPPAPPPLAPPPPMAEGSSFDPSPTGA